MTETEDVTLTNEQIAQFEAQLQNLVSIVNSGPPAEIAQKLQTQFVDRSETYLTLPNHPRNQDVSMVYQYVMEMVKGMSFDTRRRMSLSFPVDSYSENDPIMVLYNSNYRLISFMVTVICRSDNVSNVLLDGMKKAGIDGSNIDDFLIREFDILAHLQHMPEIAGIQKGNPDYGDFNANKPGNYRYLDARKKIEHVYKGEIATKVSLETGGPPDKSGRPTPLEIPDSGEADSTISHLSGELTLKDCSPLFTEKEMEITRLRLKGLNLSEIAEKVGYHDASGVSKALNRMGKKLIKARLVDHSQIAGRKL